MVVVLLSWVPLLSVTMSVASYSPSSVNQMSIFFSCLAGVMVVGPANIHW